MWAKQSIREMNVGRTVVGIFALATALAYGSLTSAAPGEGAHSAAATGCEASTSPLQVPAPVVEWSSSRGMPGQPY